MWMLHKSIVSFHSFQSLEALETKKNIIRFWRKTEKIDFWQFLYVFS